MHLSHQRTRVGTWPAVGSREGSQQGDGEISFSRAPPDAVWRTERGRRGSVGAGRAARPLPQASGRAQAAGAGGLGTVWRGGVFHSTLNPPEVAGTKPCSPPCPWHILQMFSKSVRTERPVRSHVGCSLSRWPRRSPGTGSAHALCARLRAPGSAHGAAPQCAVAFSGSGLLVCLHSSRRLPVLRRRWDPGQGWRWWQEGAVPKHRWGRARPLLSRLSVQCWLLGAGGPQCPNRHGLLAAPAEFA